MSRNITFSSVDEIWTATTKPPAYGYDFTLDMAFNFKQATNGIPVAWDNGSEFDNRICEIPKMHLNAAKQIELQTFFESTRGDLFYLGLGNAETGFFPFGADLGDYDNVYGDTSFGCTALTPEYSGVLRSPWLHFNNAITLVMKNKQQYTRPQPVNQGNFYIGNIGLYHPQDEIKVTCESGLQSDVLRGGNCSFVNNGIKADYYTAEVTLTASTANTAAIIDAFQNTHRAKNFPITCPKNIYLFGRKNVNLYNDTNTYIVRLLSNQIKFTHVRLNKFEFTLKLLLVSRS